MGDLVREIKYLINGIFFVSSFKDYTEALAGNCCNLFLGRQ
jgi:hypothetical protein